MLTLRHTPSTPSFFTTSASDARYFRQDSTETITSGVAWAGNDTKIATTGAIDARIVDLVEGSVDSFILLTKPVFRLLTLMLITVQVLSSVCLLLVHLVHLARAQSRLPTELEQETQ